MRSSALDATLRDAYDQVAGHWRSRLSSSALAAATAATAFRTALQSQERQSTELSERLAAALPLACAWLADHQNVDGGWGDSPDSPSNLSATVLAWSALHASAPAAPSVERATPWLAAACGGSPTPDRIVACITSNYGSDRTFAVPILMMCAINGVLGSGPAAWHRIPQLPCEFAVLPHAFFRYLRLGVVSYALPALIAVGLCRHRNAPTRTPTAWLRDRLTPALLRRLTALQPPHGGFLEAVPLSAFVAMSLAACGLARHPVTLRALGFLLAAQRPDDGSWPIDTNLDTWVTSLAVQALGSRERIAACLCEPADSDAILRHFLRTQHRVVHPYTRAHPGGWAWTDLPGAVPDADDTAGALVAVSLLCPAGHPCEPEALRATREGLRWLSSIQNSDGGIPTFCRGWGRLPFDRSAPDLTAHAVEAITAWLPRLPCSEARRLHTVLRRALRYLLRAQAHDGTWLPLWFGTQAAPDGCNPIFGTARVLKALAPRAGFPGVPRAVERAQTWLRARQNDDGSWGQSLHAATGTAEETGMVLCALPADDPSRPAAEAWVERHLQTGFRPSPIGLYFARLWYSEALYPAVWLTTGLG